MMFHVDEDLGYLIRGWIVPENPVASAKLRVIVSQGREYVVEASLLRKGIADLGWHHTGKVGFLIDEEVIPDLSSEPQVSVLEASEQVLIYRRFDPQTHLRKRLCFYDSSPRHVPLLSLSKRFTLFHERIDQRSHETILTLINSHFAESVLIYGMPNYGAFGGMMRDREYEFVAMLRYPMGDLAERLLLHRSEPGWREAGPLRQLFDEIDPTNDKSIGLAFRRATDEQKILLRSPVTKALGCAPDEAPNRRSVGIALQNLATMGLVGSIDRFKEFREVLSQILGTPVLEDFAMGDEPEVKSLTDRLARIASVNALLEDDLVLFSYANHAISEGFKKGLKRR